jgi:hypothetical protein
MSTSKRAPTHRSPGRKTRALAADAILESKFLPIIKGFFKPQAEALAAARGCLTTLISADPNKGVLSAEQNMMFYLSCALSDAALPGYATLDFDHIKDIEQVIASIRRYAGDASNKKPLNFLMLASPGAGKSHFIRCLAKSLGSRIGAVTYNMVGFERHEDLIPPLEAVRNFKVDDRLPLLFLDEFDSRPEHFPLLLPLLWDGQMTLGRQNLKLGKAVIILAGSGPHLPDAMERARSMTPDSAQPDADQPKLVDLLSRMNGTVLRIPDLSDPRHVTERAADKICVAVVLLRHRLGKTLQRVPLGLLKFIARTEFRYGVRSIAHLIDLIPYSENIVDLTIASLELPLKDMATLKSSSLAYHVMHDEQGHGIVNAWLDAAKITTPVLVGHESLDYTLLLVRRELRLKPEIILERLWQDMLALHKST